MSQHYYPYLAASDSNSLIIPNLSQAFSGANTWHFVLPRNFPSIFVDISEFPPLSLSVTYNPNTLMLDLDIRGLILRSDLLANISVLSNTSMGYILTKSGNRVFEISLPLFSGIVAVYTFTLILTVDPLTGINSLLIRINTRFVDADTPNPRELLNLTRLTLPSTLPVIE